MRRMGLQCIGGGRGRCSGTHQQRRRWHGGRRRGIRCNFRFVVIGPRVPVPRPSALAYDYDEIIDALEGEEDDAVDDAGEDYELAG